MRNRIKLYANILLQGLRCLTERLLHPNAAYWILTPDHDNLGDHAIAQAEMELFSKYHIKVIEVSGQELQRRRELGGLTRLMNGRPILVHGGGFLGTLWFSCELLLRDVIRQNPRSKIVLLPNTVYYEDSPEGRKELERSVEIYNAHPKLTIYTRERPSYEKAKALYRDVRLMPDMVMYMNRCRPSQGRSGCILCLRADHEKTRTAQQEQAILRQVKEVFGDKISYRDMCTDHAISAENRDRELERQYDAFRNAELVVTDRLHGMVFCAITGTPCIFVDSKSPKVKGCYEWLKHLDYIRFCEDPAHLAELYSSMPKGDQIYDNSGLTPYYEQLARYIKTMIGKQ